MNLEGVPKGYVVNQYQFARRYKYNSHSFIDYFNSIVEKEEEQYGKYQSPTGYISFGEYDLLEIIKINSFKKYHDVSEMAKEWVGKRQSVLLYDISDQDSPTRFYFDENGKRKWIDITNGKPQVLTNRFCCLSMMSLTNEIIEGIADIPIILKNIRKHILDLVDRINNECNADVHCEVFGTFNTAEIGIIWLGDQYTDILRLIDFIKFLEFEDATGKKCRAFFSSYSSVAFHRDTIKVDTNLDTVKGEAVIQMALHDQMNKYETIKEIYRIFSEKNKPNADEEKLLSYYVGEYDFGIKLSVSKVLSLITKSKTKKFFVNSREPKGKYVYDDNDISSGIIRTNIRLFYTADDVNSLDEIIKTDDSELLIIHIDKNIKEFKHYFEKKELFNKEEYEWFFKDNEESEISSVKSLYEDVRAELKSKITSSAGAVDTLDLLYTDYKSVISSAYNAVWVSDFHRQFHSILYQIKLLIKSQDNQSSCNSYDLSTIKWKWSEFQDLTNAFKQQIYHLSQSSRMFFETPNCHFRSTGQYDFLMHTYYGIAKNIIETIYLLQGSDPQSELIPLITVNTVPQVKSQLYFECGKSDEMRTINIDVPNSIIFDPCRGMCYLTHELFHYSVPKSRKERNRIIGIFFIFKYFSKRIFLDMQDMFERSLSDHHIKYSEQKNTINVFCSYFNLMFRGNSTEFGSIKNKFGVEKEDFWKIFDDLELDFFNYVKKIYSTEIESNLKVETDTLSSNFQDAITKFCLSSDSHDLYNKIFKYVLCYVNCRICKLFDESKLVNYNLKFIIERIKYCITNTSFFNSYLALVQNECDQELYKDAAKLNRINEINKFLINAIKEARVDIAMVSLNGMNLEDYLLFCVQCFDDDHFFDNCVDNIANDEVVSMRIALVIEYFHSQDRNGWKLKDELNNQGDVVNYILDDDSKKSFEEMYLWNYRAKYYKESLQNLRDEAFQKLYFNCQKWIEYFEKIINNFIRYYSKFYDGFLETIISDCDVVRRINSTHKDEVKKRLLAIKRQFSDVYNGYRLLLKKSFKGYTGSFEYIEEHSEFNAKYLEYRFAQDLNAVSLFQNQKTLKELRDLNDEIKAHDNHYCDDLLICEQIGYSEFEDNSQINTEFHAYSLDDLNFYVNHCINCFNETVKQLSASEDGGDSQELQMRNVDTVWFRGETNLKYSLNPALMRKYDENKVRKFGSLSKYHRSNYEEFKFRADGASEMPTGVRFTKSDYVALMQHYEISTNFLDWTETLMTSLYFGLKYYFQYTDEELEKPENKKYKRDVCLYLFHPGLYNSFRSDILKTISDKLGELPHTVLSNHYFTDVYSEKSFAANLIPNLSTKENEEIFDMFILGDSSFDHFYTLNKDKITTELTKYESLKELFLPIAVWTSRLNSRIRTQSGCFVAFNLYSPQNVLTSDDGKPYDYISLMSIQDRHKPYKGKNRADRVFLYKIVIDKDCCREVVNWLKGIGVTAETVYPELEQLKGRFN